jgi:hypothetical protein
LLNDHAADRASGPNQRAEQCGDRSVDVKALYIETK